LYGRCKPGADRGLGSSARLLHIVVADIPVREDIVMATQQADRARGWTDPARKTTDGVRGGADAVTRSDLRPWVVIAVVGLVGFAIVTGIVATGVTIPFDRPLLDALRGLGQYMEVWRDVSASANLPLIAIGVGIVAWLAWRHQFAEAAIVVGLLAVITAGSELVKQVIARPRPPGFVNGELGVVYSYPSGHILEATVIYGIIAVLIWRSTLPRPVRFIIPIVFAAILALIAVSRVAVGAHYPSDVLGGFLAGIGFLALFVIATELLRRHEATRHEATRHEATRHESSRRDATTDHATGSGAGTDPA
jgi:undecaprenyl-diphosphatase